MWAPLQAVVSVVEVLGGETIIYANLNLDTPDDEVGAIIIKADPDTLQGLYMCRRFSGLLM